MTKKEMFAEIRKVVIDNEEMVAFIDHQIELLENKSKSPRKPTKTQQENIAFREKVYEALIEADTAITMKELFEACPDIAGLSTQRVTHLLTDLIKEGKVERTIEKKVRFYKAIA